MKRVVATPRSNLTTRIRDLGFEFASMDDGRLYWDETTRYEFTLEEIERDLEASTNELWSLCVDVVASAVRDEAAMDRLGILPTMRDAVAASWQTQRPSLYGRFDLAYDGRGPAKLLEFNADTPTSLYEAAVFQWHWLEDGLNTDALPPDADQFNSIHERLIDRWRDIAGSGSVLHLACLDNVEDRVTIEYIADCASQAGVDARCLLMNEIGKKADGLVGLRGERIARLFKLYPWEWLINDEWGLSQAVRSTEVVEPAWKMLLSNKALLAELWARAPGHPNLLETYRATGDDRHPLAGRDHVVKPIHSREGSNVSIVKAGAVVEKTGGPYIGPTIIQAYADNLFKTADGHAIVGSWIIGRRASGIGMREDTGLITKNTSRFIPHAIVG